MLMDEHCQILKIPKMGSPSGVVVKNPPAAQQRKP